MHQRVTVVIFSSVYSSDTLMPLLCYKSNDYSIIGEKKTFKNVKNRFRVALNSMETRKSQLCPLHIG